MAVPSRSQFEVFVNRVVDGALTLLMPPLAGHSIARPRDDKLMARIEKRA
jgi:hypothetical protein